jgi:hypothetical protein
MQHGGFSDGKISISLHFFVGGSGDRVLEKEEKEEDEVREEVRKEEEEASAAISTRDKTKLGGGGGFGLESRRHNRRHRLWTGVTPRPEQ